ncbi:hypothetical protein KI688_005292 [Linnemannia hyalina]|uniref:F-box domain-containing protein n=1 Tax=Linnemannia hyalina TaxID=64524 RepID=A0A9P7XKS5_9FUNG|nr:hypothetical protein KI688_005292 [Linnemannia hyalina]
MSQHNLSFINSSFTTIAINLPELVESIRHHLDQSDLYACVRVNRAWNEAFIPLLWYAIDTHTLTWCKIINDDASGKKRSRNDTERWVMAILEKYGHHIRHFDVHWDVVLEAAALSSSGCKGLVSLAVDAVWHNHRTLVTVLTGPTGSHGVDVVMGFDVFDEVHPPVTWSTRKWAEFMDIYEYKEQARHQRDIEQFFSLIRQNPGLVRITFPGTIKDLPTGLLTETFGGLRNLKELDLEWMALDVEVALEAVPGVEKLRGYALTGFTSLQRRYGALRVLSYQRDIEFLSLLVLLKHLPGLEELWLWKIVSNTPSSAYSIVNAAVSATELFPQVRVLRLDGPLTIRDDALIALLVGVFPGLDRFWIPVVREEVKKALEKKCCWLREIHSDGRTIEAWMTVLQRRGQREDS